MNPFLNKVDGGIHEICRNLGCDPYHCLLLQKYDNTIVVVNEEFRKVKMHPTEDYRALSVLTECFENNLFVVQCNIPRGG